MATRSEKISEVVEKYDTKPISEIRADIATLVDEVNNRSRRMVLTKHGKPVAALMPIEDLVDLDISEGADFRYMAQQSREKRAAEQEPLDEEQLRLLYSIAEALPGKNRIEKLSALQAAMSALVPLVKDMAYSLRIQMEESIRTVQMPDESRRQIQERFDEAVRSRSSTTHAGSRAKERSVL
jgi:prevent-host-death family protein